MPITHSCNKIGDIILMTYWPNCMNTTQHLHCRRTFLLDCWNTAKHGVRSSWEKGERKTKHYLTVFINSPPSHVISCELNGMSCDLMWAHVSLTGCHVTLNFYPISLADVFVCGCNLGGHGRDCTVALLQVWFTHDIISIWDVSTLWWCIGLCGVYWPITTHGLSVYNYAGSISL